MIDGLGRVLIAERPVNVDGPLSIDVEWPLPAAYFLRVRGDAGAVVVPFVKM